MSQDLIGIDSNILVYAFDKTEGEKHREAKNLVLDLTKSKRALLSVQNLTEFYFVSTKHIEKPVTEQKAMSAVEDFSKSCTIEPIRPEHTLKAVGSHSERKLDFWDCLLAETLKHNKVKKIITENTQDFHDIEGIEPENPFK